jgi:hypothetical protein
MKTIYFDESGNTGPDLLNRDQPIYILCSTDMKENDAENALANYFDITKELHFKKLKQSKKNKESILKFFSERINDLEKYCKVTAYHKEYMIACKMLDYLVEPQLYEDGIDYYDEGMNIAHANMFYYCFEGFCGKEITRDVYTKFVNMIAEKKRESVIEFSTALMNAYNNCGDEQFKGEFIILNKALYEIDSFISAKSKADLDPALSALIDLIQRWMMVYNDELQIYHHESVTIEARKEDLEYITSKLTEPATVGYGQVKAKFPLNIKEFKFEKSQNSRSIQICDLVASAFVFAEKGGGEYNVEFCRELRSILANFKFDNMVWPSLNVERDKKRKRLDTDINPIDYMVQQMVKNKKI